MNFVRPEAENRNSQGRSAKRIAVVGAGISGLGAAYLLSNDHRVVLFEAEKQFGGHARTVIAGRDVKVPVDTGFIVFNDRNYPLLCALFRTLNVPVKKSKMSFAASFDDGAWEYSTRSLNSLFADRRNLLQAQHWGMIRDVLRFNARAVETVATDPELTLRDLLDHLGLGRWFRDRYLLPVSGAIWSTPPHEMLDFPAQAFTRFFHNHGLLTINDQPQWWTVDGGSCAYVQRLCAAIESRGAKLRPNTKVAAVERSANGVVVSAQGHDPEHFDAVVMATHSDQALALLADADAEEKQCLSALKYKPNRAVLHDDVTQMPKRKACWASWVYKGSSKHCVDPESHISLTYWMNCLQSIRDDVPLFVTLNPTETIPDENVFDEVTFHHPQFDRAAIYAQTQINTLNGKRNTWFCGAYCRNGFHEDALWSAARVAEALGAEVKWA